VILSPPLRSGGRLADGGAKYTQGLDTDSVPAALQRHFGDPAPTASAFTTIHSTRDIAGVAEGPGVVVGNQVTLPADGQTYTLYYLFSLEEEGETLALVQRALLTAGVLLLLLVAGLTWLVARQVVTPIRMARRVAERLAAGQLQERLRVRGEDDLARLATSFNQMASNLQRQIRQLEELSRLQRRFVSDVSHELRTPLTTVRMAGDMLHDARDSFDPASARAAELLQTELDRFETLLSDLLEISRFDAGAAALDIGQVDLTEVARRVVEVTRAVATQRDTRVVVHATGPCVAQGDVRRVERVVRNLVSNAIDHAESHDVEVFVAADDHAAALAVRDHGVGLAPGESAMVFNRFWRADPARARTSGGTGLGLSIALEDAHLHGGWLQAWGRPGEGAHFRLTLPRRTGEMLRHSPLPLVPPDVSVTGTPPPGLAVAPRAVP
jgi:two-component system sensor histidine kinase MtrB